MALAVVALAAALGARAEDAAACAPAPRVGEYVRVASESAVIVWDETSQTEHFIRRASFRGTARDFGFLVPTPTRPELAAIEDHVFDALAWATRPRVETRHETSGVELASCFSFLLGAAERSAAPGSAGAVRVLEETKVAGYDAAVLQADDPGLLAEWLRTRGYAEGPSLAEWLAPYVEKKWVLTAFKVAAPPTAPPSARPLGTEAVRMTFKTERPFFPYREPSDQRAPLPPEAKAAEGPRELLLYVVAPKRMAATVGEIGPFPGSIPFAKKITMPPALTILTAGLADPVTTVLVDPSSPRPGTDELWLAPSGEQGEVEPPPIIEVVKEPVPIPVEPVVTVAGIAAALVLRRRKRGG